MIARNSSSILFVKAYVLVIEVIMLCGHVYSRLAFDRVCEKDIDQCVNHANE